MQENLHIRFQGGKESQWEFQEFTLIGKWGQKLSMFFNEVISKSHHIKAFWWFQIWFVKPEDPKMGCDKFLF